MTHADVTARNSRPRLHDGAFTAVVLARGNHRAVFAVESLASGGARLIGDLALARGEQVTVLLDLERIVAVVGEVVGSALLEDTGKHDVTIVFHQLPPAIGESIEAWVRRVYHCELAIAPAVVLVVDDDVDARVGLDRDLATLGRAVRLAASPSEALEFLADASVRYDAVIVDHWLGTPQEDFVHHLKTQFPNVPRILLSEGREDVLEREVAVGRVHAVLAKPWLLDDLARALHRATRSA